MKIEIAAIDMVKERKVGRSDWRVNVFRIGGCSIGAVGTVWGENRVELSWSDDNVLAASGGSMRAVLERCGTLCMACEGIWSPGC